MNPKPSLRRDSLEKAAGFESLPSMTTLSCFDLNAPGIKGQSPIQRFWDAVDKNGPNGCWIWNGVMAGGGYGYFYVTRTNATRAHRFSFMLANGDIEPGLVIDHICRVRRCVNPNHLRMTTNRENILAGVGVGAIAARQKACIRGHPYSKEATEKARSEGARRRCGICRAMLDKIRLSAPAAKEVKVGQVYRDNDPRENPHDIILIQCATSPKGLRFLCQRGPKKVWILAGRLAARGSRGYTLVKP